VPLQNLARRLLNSRASPFLLDVTNQLIYRERSRRFLISSTDLWLRLLLRRLAKSRSADARIRWERTLLARAVLHTVDRVLAGGQVSPHVMRAITERWGHAWALSSRTQPHATKFRQEHGCAPPWFLVLSPSSVCNLRCPGCYADSGAEPRHLPWPVLERVMREARQLWGVPLFVFSGGEPLLYRSEGHDVLDAVERHPDCLFLMFTNGTRIDERTARRMERLANLTPALSVEGMQEETDARRGRGQFERTLRVMARLREAGVPFGISATLTRSNLDEILSDRFVDFFFHEQGAFYGFLFQYMPIGRDAEPERMPSPTQRLEAWRRGWTLIERKRIFLFDFWNHGPMVGGCMSGGRQGGYLYIDWAGLVMPCVFVPYAVADIQKVYARGETLDHVWNAPFLQAIRAWQEEYGYAGGPIPTSTGNWLRPCPIRDHYATFRRWVEQHAPEPEDEAARLALDSSSYLCSMNAYDEALEAEADRIWLRDYLSKG
jgi:MoaA/NifB/PqqE/SkfB family radical SAM enzyme